MNRNRTWLLALFFLSGVSGLVYESVWSRTLRLWLGSAAIAQVLVLALFMGGMSIGALLAARGLRRLSSPIRAYAVCEGLIGLHALAFPLLSRGMQRAGYDWVLPSLGGGTAVTLAKWTMGALLILPPCVLLGMTFPWLSAGLIRRDPARSGEVLSGLYFTNSLGAAAGALACGLLLVPWLGLSGAMRLAGGLNLVVMASVLVLDRGGQSAAQAPVSPTAQVPAGTLSLGLPFWIAFGTGLSSFLYEIGWIRLLSMVVGSATQSFDVMLSAFVLGMAAGGLWVRKRVDRFERPVLALATAQFVMGVAAIATLPLYRVGVGAIAWLFTHGDRSVALWYGFHAVRYGVCLLIMLPATFCAGMTLPLLTHILLRAGRSEASIGHVYAANTVGSIAGAVLGGLVLMPAIGLHRVIVTGAAIDLALGVILLRLDDRAQPAIPGASTVWRPMGVVALFAAVAGMLLLRPDSVTLTSTVYRYGKTDLGAASRIVSYTDGRTATVAVAELDSGAAFHALYTNGKPDASVTLERFPLGRDKGKPPVATHDEPNQILTGMMPLLARPGARQVALIGFGSGMSAHVLLGSPHLERLDTVEIEPAIVEASRLFRKVNHRAYEDPRHHLHFDDAKAYFAWAGRKYDLIVSEPTNPWVSGVASLFTVEFYQEMRRYLRPGGLLAQWIQGYEMGDALLVPVLAALDSVYDDYLIVQIGARDWMILASPDQSVGVLDPEALGWEGMQGECELLGLDDIGRVDSLLVANRRMLRPFLRTQPRNTEDRPLLESGAERARFLQKSAALFHGLRSTAVPVREVLGGLEPRPYPSAEVASADLLLLLAPESGASLLRQHATGIPAKRAAVRTDEMVVWEHDSAIVRGGNGSWKWWAELTWAIYSKAAPFLPVEKSRWWLEVMFTATKFNAPAFVGRAVEVMAALRSRNGKRLAAAVEAVEPSDGVIPAEVLDQAGLLALELSGPTAEQKLACLRAAGPFVASDLEDRELVLLAALRARICGAAE